jgi:hypothetical protein
MDETGARVGCPKGEEVVVPVELKELYTASPENRLSVTIIETICADSSKPIPPVIICPGVRIMESWFGPNPKPKRRRPQRSVRGLKRENLRKRREQSVQRRRGLGRRRSSLDNRL